MIRRLLTVAPTALLLAACGGGGGDVTVSGSALGSLSLGITDGPVDSAFSVVIQFTGLTLKPASGSEITIEFDSPMSIDLLEYQGDNAAPLLINETVPAGRYNWIELHVNAEQNGQSDSYLIDSIGEHELRIPSGAQSGLRLVSGFNVADVALDGTSNFTIDFDLRKSITSPPGPGSDPTFLLKPALRMVNNLEVGTISGTVDNSLVAATCVVSEETDNVGAVYLYSPVIGEGEVPADMSPDGGPIATALVAPDDQGGYAYEFGFVQEGDYSIAYTCHNESDDPEVTGDPMEFVGLTDIQVSRNQVKIQDFNL